MGWQTPRYFNISTPSSRRDNYDTRKQMFPKDDLKHVVKDFKKNIQFKDNRYITKLLIRKTEQLYFSKQSVN